MYTYKCIHMSTYAYIYIYIHMYIYIYVSRQIYICIHTNAYKYQGIPIIRKQLVSTCNYHSFPAQAQKPNALGKSRWLSSWRMNLRRGRENQNESWDVLGCPGPSLIRGEPYIYNCIYIYIYIYNDIYIYIYHVWWILIKIIRTAGKIADGELLWV